MTDSPPGAGGEEAGTTDVDFDRAFFGPPDPVELFAASLDQSLRHLRVEVAGLRAERDGLRLEVEGLRAKLTAAQVQLQQRSAMDTTLAEMRALVHRLSGASPSAASAEPRIAGPEVAGPAPEPPPATPSALDQLRAMGVWPLRPRVTAIGEPAAQPPLAEPDAAGPQPPPLAEGDRPDAPVPASVEPTAPDREGSRGHDERSRLRRWTMRAVATLGVVLIVIVLLVSIGPRVLPYQTYSVRSGSMEPTIPTGAIVVLTKAEASSLGPDDIITFERPDRPGTLVTHRIVGVEDGPSGPVFVTRGDANGTPDPWRVPAAGDGWRYAFDVPVLGYVFGALGTPLARLLLLALPATVLAVLSLAGLRSRLLER